MDCKICNKSFDSVAGLHIHLGRGEKISQEEYYAKYYPRYDLFTKGLIPFKSYDEYFKQNFISKKTEFAFLENAANNGIAKGILIEQLKECAAKSKNRFPTYCEWRSSKLFRYDQMVRFGFFEEFLGFARKMGLQFNLGYSDPQNKMVLKDNEILVDTREQKPLFNGKKTTINIGDYTLSKENYNGIHVDRKSQEDFILTFTSGLERFKKECAKAKEMDVYLVVLVEASFLSCFNYKPFRKKQMVGGQNAFYGVRSISRAFKNVQFLFVENRDEAKQYVNLILNNPEVTRNLDLQFIYEKQKRG